MTTCTEASFGSTVSAECASIDRALSFECNVLLSVWSSVSVMIAGACLPDAPEELMRPAVVCEHR